MSPKQKEKVVADLLTVLSTNNVTFAEVPEVVTELNTSLDQMCQEQVIQFNH